MHALGLARLPTLPLLIAAVLGFTCEAEAAPTAADPVSAEPKVTFELPHPSLSKQDRETVATCLVLESASDGEFGMRAVMSVIRNRAHGQPELFVPTVLKPKQFSALNRVTAGRESMSAAAAKARRDPMWDTALAIVDEAAGEQWSDPTGGATHYTRTGERNRWTRALARLTVIGGHSFYR
jgi:spore germination cell wall hydrolase CwlJ-like protein